MDGWMNLWLLIAMIITDQSLVSYTYPHRHGVGCLSGVCRPCFLTNCLRLSALLSRTSSHPPQSSVFDFKPNRLILVPVTPS